MSAFLKSLDGLFKSQCYGIGVFFLLGGAFIFLFYKRKKATCIDPRKSTRIHKGKKKKLKQASPSDINVEIAVRKYKFK